MQLIFNFQKKHSGIKFEIVEAEMPRGKQAPPARGEDDASSDDSMSSGFLTHSTLDEQRFSFFLLLRKEIIHLCIRI